MTHTTIMGSHGVVRVPEKYADAIRLVALLLRLPVEQVAGVEREPNTAWNPSIHCDHDEDGLHPAYARRVKDAQVALDTYAAKRVLRALGEVISREVPDALSPFHDVPSLLDDHKIDRDCDPDKPRLRITYHAIEMTPEQVQGIAIRALGGHACHDEACEARGNHGCHVDECQETR